MVSAGEDGHDSATHIFSETINDLVSTDDSFERVVFQECLGRFGAVVEGSFTADARNELVDHIPRIIPQKLEGYRIIRVQVRPGSEAISDTCSMPFAIPP